MIDAFKSNQTKTIIRNIFLVSPLYLFIMYFFFAYKRLKKSYSNSLNRFILNKAQQTQFQLVVLIFFT
jgi:hypothetical protein